MNSKVKQSEQVDGKLPWGELIVCNGRHAGARRPLVGPLTVLGRAVGSDIRLQIEGVESRHCVLAQTPEGPALRDLQSESGTFVNGARIRSVVLQEGDVFAVGLLEFKIQGLAPASSQVAPDADASKARDAAVRVQVAAVAAQQIALDEEELKLEQRRQALTQQEEQVSAHLEEKRRQILALSEESKAERESLDRERAAYETHIAKITGDLTNAQREIMEGQRHVEKQRQRMLDLNQRLKQRWHRFWIAERKKFRAQQAEFVQQIQFFEERVEEHNVKQECVERSRLRFNALYELGRGQLREAWAKVRREQHRWKHRRGKERAALKVRERDLENAERQLVQAQRLFLLDKKAWDAKKQLLETELGGVDQRVSNQRLRIRDGRDTLRLLDESLHERQRAAAPALLEVQPAAHVAVAGDSGVLSDNTAGAAGETRTPPIASVPVPLDRSRKSRKAARSVVVAGANAPPRDAEWRNRLEELQTLSGALADQRLELVDQWQRLAILFRAWQQEKESATNELEELAQKLLLQGKSLARQEEEHNVIATDLQHRQENVVQLRHQMIAWRTRLRAKEQSWEGERAKLLAQTRHRETLAEQQHAGLVDLRQRWSAQRKQELAQLQTDRDELETLRKEAVQARAQIVRHAATLEDEKRQLTEKALALEQFRQEVLQKTEPSLAERKLERFRRRWLTQNSVTLRQIASERETLRTELAALDLRGEECKKRTETVAAAEAALAAKQTAWEHQQTLALTRQSRLEEELKHAEQQRNLSEHQYGKLQEEVDRIARAIFAEPEAPLLLTEVAA